MATDAKSLIAQAACYDCYGGGTGSIQLMKLALLAQISQSLNPLNATDPKSLIAQASCYSCYGSSPGVMQLMELALLAQISQSGGVGGGVSCGNYAGGQPNFTPTSTCAVAIDTSNGTIWWYYNGQWN